jgi:hypothetical protein
VLDSEEAEDMPNVRSKEEEAEAAEEEQNTMESETDAEANEVPSAVENVIEGTEGNEAVQNNNAASGDVHDLDSRMPGQLPTEASATVNDYH